MKASLTFHELTTGNQKIYDGTEQDGKWSWSSRGKEIKDKNFSQLLTDVFHDWQSYKNRVAPTKK